MATQQCLIQQTYSLSNLRSLPPVGAALPLDTGLLCVQHARQQWTALDAAARRAEGGGPPAGHWPRPGLAILLWQQPAGGRQPAAGQHQVCCTEGGGPPAGRARCSGEDCSSSLSRLSPACTPAADAADAGVRGGEGGGVAIESLGCTGSISCNSFWRKRR